MNGEGLSVNNGWNRTAHGFRSGRLEYFHDQFNEDIKPITPPTCGAREVKKGSFM